MICIRPTGIGLLEIEHAGPRNVVGVEYVTEGGCHTVILAVPRGVRVRNPVVGQRHGIRVVAEALTDVARPRRLPPAFPRYCSTMSRG